MRASRRDLREPGGEVPPGYPTPGYSTVGAGAFLFGLSALGHAAEGVITMTNSLSLPGRGGPMLGFAEILTLILGMLLIAIGLWRARIASIWPVFVFLLILPADGALPHGIAQQAARSAILILVTAWLAWPLAQSRSAAPGSGKLPAGNTARV